MPLILLTSVSVSIIQLKNYLFSCEDRSNWFTIPDETVEKAKRRANKIVLVLDMDETLIYSRRE